MVDDNIVSSSGVVTASPPLLVVVVVVMPTVCKEEDTVAVSRSNIACGCREEIVVNGEMQHASEAHVQSIFILLFIRVIALDKTAARVENPSYPKAAACFESLQGDTEDVMSMKYGC